MATPRGGRKFFQAMGQSAAARNDLHALSLGDLIDNVPPWAFEAFRTAYFALRPTSQYSPVPVFPDRVTQVRVTPATAEQRVKRYSPKIDVSLYLRKA